MVDWFLGLSLIGKIWVVYPTLAVLLLGLATYTDLAGSAKVNGAGGWLMFGAIMITGYGLILMILLTGIIWLVQLFL